MATKSQARLFAQLIAEYEPRIRRGFMASVTDLSANVDFPLLLSQLEAGNLQGAIDALNISPAAWSEYSAAVTQTFAASGSAHAAQIRELGIGSIGTRFDVTNPRAEQWIRENVAESVVGFNREQVEVARETIEAGYSAGKGPRDIATDLAGRTTGSGGARQGGVLGLDGPRADRLRRVTEGMKTPEGVQSLVVQHRNGSLSLKYRTNKATANRILAAYRKGEAVPASLRTISERQYHNALLKSRADTVAETETGNAVLGSRDEEWRQIIESGDVRADKVRKVWRHGRGPTRYHREDHLQMSGTTIEGIDATFNFADGIRMKFAHDPAGGAKHLIRCGCSVDYSVMDGVD